MRDFNFRKTARRNDFTLIFGGAGKRRSLKNFLVVVKGRVIQQFDMQRTRRANVGWRNKKWNAIHKFKMFMFWGMKKRKTTSRFRR